MYYITIFKILYLRSVVSNLKCFVSVFLVLAPLRLIQGANHISVDSIVFPEDGVVNSISKRQVNNIYNLVYQIPDRFVDNRHTLINQRQQVSPLAAAQTRPHQSILSTIPSFPNTQSPSFNFNFDPITDFAWTTFKVSLNEIKIFQVSELII